MAFVNEIVPEKDKEFWYSMKFKDCWNIDSKLFIQNRTHWVANREANAFLQPIGGGMHDIPLIHDLWWNGITIRIECDTYQNSGNRRLPKGLSIVWNIHKVFIPQSVLEHKDYIVELVEEAFSKNCDGAKIENVISISIQMDKIEIIEEEAK